MATKKPSKTAIRYDDKFKAKAVAEVIEKGEKISAVAAKLGVTAVTLRQWVRDAQGGSSLKISNKKNGASGQSVSEHRYFEMLGQNEQLKDENQFLRKMVKDLSQPTA